MKNILRSIAFVILATLSNLCFGQYANLEFVENKGQWDPNIKFQGLMSAGAFNLQKNGFRVVIHNTDDLKNLSEYFHFHNDSAANTHTSGNYAGKNPHPKKSVTVRSHAYDVNFINTGNPTIAGEKPLPSINNYFIGNDPSKWAGDCKIYQAITYKNMYPNVDVRYYTNNGHLKYDIIVHPGASISNIKMMYEGVDGLSIKNEQLIVKTSVGEMKELAPYSYQVVNGLRKEIPSRFKVSGNLVQFELGEFAKDAILVIDPTLIFSTFTGSTADNWGYTATYGSDGSFYSGGIVRNGNGFPTSPGAFQTTYQGGSDDEEGIGGFDIGIMKFSPNGTNRMYATYLGGSSNEQPHSLVVDAAGNLVVAGRTASSNFPITNPAFNGGGQYDIFLTKLNANGTALIGSRKIGGPQNDGVNIRAKYAGVSGSESIRRNYGDDARSEVILDQAGNIVLASNTKSGSSFPVTANAFQRTPGGGPQDGVIIKTTPDLNTILFSSFIGGTGNDAAFVLAVNPINNNIYIGGNTDADGLPGDKTGVLGPNFGGQTDGFVSIITNDGSSILKTTYIGTGAFDMLYGIQFDKFGFPYIMGTTTGDWPRINAPFVQNGKQFIAKMQPDLSAFIYSTTFGTGSAMPNISPVAFLVDRCENVYVSGWGGDINITQKYDNSGTNGLSTTPDALSRNTDGSDFYFFVLERNAARQLYGSFYGQFSTQSGGEHVDGGTSRFDRDGVIYQAMCANCGRSAAFPTTPGVWSPSNGSNECNLAAVKIAFNLAGIASSLRTSVNGVLRDTSGCVPLTVEFTDTIGAGTRYIWDFGDGSAREETTAPTISHTFNNIGTFRVKLISIDSASCNIADSSFTYIRVRNDEAAINWTSTKVGPCDSYTYQFNNTSVAPPGKPFTNQSFMWYFGDNSAPVRAGAAPVTHTFPGIGTYNVRLVLLDTNYCNAPDSLVRPLRISPNVDAQFETPATGCAPYTAVFNNTSAGGQNFYWSFGDGSTSTEMNPQHLYTNPGVYTIRLLVVDSATCNISDSTSFTIRVNPNPVASFTYSPVPPQENTPVQFFNSSLGATNYKWLFGDGDSLVTSSSLPIQHIYLQTGKFNACLIAYNDAGCSDTLCVELEARVVPLIDVSNAFTPNNDGVNDKVFVRGYGINKLNWKIYNRWGTLVFQTGSLSQGWDGTYKGKLQPKEVYHYVLDVEFSDGTQYQKKGDITLL